MNEVMLNGLVCKKLTLILTDCLVIPKIYPSGKSNVKYYKGLITILQFSKPSLKILNRVCDYIFKGTGDNITSLLSN